LKAIRPLRFDTAVAEVVAAPPAAPATRSWRWLAAPLVAFALFSLTAGLLARHEPRSKGYFRLFFSDPVHLKAGFASAAAVLACFQVFSAAWIFRKLPWRKPAWINAAHRWSGRLAFVCTLPVAYHCIFKLGFRTTGHRVLAHSLLGCGVYGAYAAKVTIVRLHRFPKPVLPVAGGLLFALLIGIWYSSALWLYGRDSTLVDVSTSARIIPVIPRNANPASGAKVFAQSGCGTCHTLEAAGANGQIGPNLDALRPTYERALTQVTKGGGGMPAYGKKLTAAQIRDVAAFVASTAGG
jgi:cytochrome c553